MSSFLDRCIFTAASGGTGSFVVSSPVLGYLTPAQANAVTATVYSYAAQSADLTQWEVGTGTYTVSTVTLTRTPIFSTNGNAAVNFTNPPSVMITVLAEDMLNPTFAVTSATLTFPGSGVLSFNGGASTLTGGVVAEIQAFPKMHCVTAGASGADQFAFVADNPNTSSFATVSMLYSVGGGTRAQIDMQRDATNAGGTMFFKPYDSTGTANIVLQLTTKQDCVVGNAALATNATDGFLYIPTCAGTPTGTPSSFTGRVPMIFDTTNSQFWFYTGGAWKQPKTPAAAATVTWQ